MKFRVLHIIIAFVFSFQLNQFVVDNGHTDYVYQHAVAGHMHQGAEISLHGFIAPGNTSIKQQLERKYKILPWHSDEFTDTEDQKDLESSDLSDPKIDNHFLSISVKAFALRGPPVNG